MEEIYHNFILSQIFYSWVGKKKGFKQDAKKDYDSGFNSSLNKLIVASFNLFFNLLL